MYIAMQCADSNGTLNTEICTFYGIKYDSRYRSALISTEHLNHDYVVPIDPKDYETLRVSYGAEERVSPVMLSLRRSLSHFN